MNEQASPFSPAQQGATVIPEHTVEIVSDSGEGAQKAGQIFGALSAKMGNGVWTVEIIPAEIKPPARSKAGASGIRIRIGEAKVTNMGDEADLVVAFNEQVLYGRIANGAYRPGTVVLLENKWASHPDEAVQAQYAEGLAELNRRGFEVKELALEKACLAHTPNPRVGKNMFVLGMLCWIYDRDLNRARTEIANVFGRKGKPVVARNVELLEGGYQYAKANLDLHFKVRPRQDLPPQVVTNGNQAIGLGVMGAGIELVSMYPITPATSASHFLAREIERVGGVVHQAEDEIAAIGFAVGASYAGKTACTITSGPGMALKTEFMGLAIMAEVPLVMVLVQRGGPSTGLPTKVEQGDLMAAIYGTPGDAPKIVLAAATIDECFHLVITARQLAETFRTLVILLTDANLATGVAPWDRPDPQPEWLAPPLDQSPWQKGLPPYAWDAKTGLSPRPIPGQRDGMYVLTGLAHTDQSKVAYDPESNETGCQMRSKKLDTLRNSLAPPRVHGAEQGDLLVVGWGSTLGAIEEAVDRVRAKGGKVSSVHLRFLSPMAPGMPEIMAGFRQTMTVEINYSDPADFQNRRRAQLAQLLRAEYLADVDSWSQVQGQPLSPRDIEAEIWKRLNALNEEAA